MLESRCTFECLAVSNPERNVSCLLRDQALVVPGALQHGLAGEQRAQARMFDSQALVVPVRHNVQKSLQRWASAFDAAIVEVALGNARMRLDDRLQTGD